MANRRTPLQQFGRSLWLSEYSRAAAISGAACALLLLVRSRVQPIDVAMAFLLAVVLVAARYRRGPAILTVVLSVALFDFFFVPPFYTLSVLDRSYIFSFGIMFIVALAMSRLTGEIREQREEVREREQGVSSLYHMLRELAAASGHAEQVAVAARHIGGAAGGDAEVILVEELRPEERPPHWPSGGAFADVAIRLAATWAYEHGEIAGRGTRRGAEADALIAPLQTPSRTLGVVVVSGPTADWMPSDSQRRTAQALAEQAAIVLERGAPVRA